MFPLLFIFPLLVVFTTFFPVFAGKNIFLNGDTLFGFFYYFYYYAAGGPLMSQHILSGFPILVSVAGIWFYPINDLFLNFFTAFDAYRYMNIVNIFLTYLCSYGYARVLNYDRKIAIVGSMVFTFSGQLMLWAETLTNTNYYFVLPLALWMLEVVKNSNRYLYKLLATLILGVSLGFAWTSGHVQYTVYIHTFAFFYALFLFNKSQLSWKKVEALISLLFAYILSVLIGFRQIMAILSWREVSARSGGVSLSDYYIGSYWPWDFIHTLLPFFSLPKIPFSNPNLYIGIIPLILVVIGLTLWRKILDPHYRFFVLVLGFCLIASIHFSPLGLIIHNLPLFNSFREAPRIMFIGSFAAFVVIMAVLRYMSLHKNETEVILAKHIFVWRVLGLILLPIMLVAWVINVFFFNAVFSLLHRIVIVPGQLPGEQSVDYYTDVLSQFLQVSLGSLSITHYQNLIFFICLGFSIYLLLKYRTLTFDRWVSSIIVVVTLNIILVYWGHYQFISQADLYRVPESATFIKGRQTIAPERFFPVLPGQSAYQLQTIGCGSSDPQESYKLQSEFILPNSNILFGLDTISGYDNFMPRRVSEMLAFVGSENAVTPNMLANMATSTENKIRIISERKNILRMMNVRYLITTYPFDDPAFKKVWSKTVGDCHIPISIYELDNYWPRYFVIDRYEKVDASNAFSDSLDRIMDRGEKPLVVLEESIPAEMGILERKGDAKYNLVLPNVKYDSIAFTISEPTSKLLVIGNSWLPGFKADIDGKPVKIYRANYLYMAIPVPAGDHVVTLRYVY